eukprot:gnl/Chilomastix_caulleri/5696.p2 GENE.gnl/Chilomastix_caulleri/5696~~gnl/Chilomastix_caulleri/5696.p2  ORF type:complete len:65 (+),score=19.53 gnl/Chilomastix_caulleri/5696:86-280(+)
MVNLMTSAPRQLLPIIGGIQEVVGQIGAVFGQFIAVTIRDMLVPVFETTTDPTCQDRDQDGEYD